MLLSDDDCDAFVGAHANEDERAAYGLLRTGAQRADLFRLLFLKAIGGVYADLDLELRTPLRRVLPPTASSVVRHTWTRGSAQGWVGLRVQLGVRTEGPD